MIQEANKHRNEKLKGTRELMVSFYYAIA